MTGSNPVLVISDCWSAYRNLETHGYAHQTVKHTIGFAYLRYEEHTNMIDTMWLLSSVPTTGWRTTPLTCPNTFAAGYWSDNLHHFIGMFATIDLSATSPHNAGNVAVAPSLTRWSVVANGSCITRRYNTIYSRLDDLWSTLKAGLHWYSNWVSNLYQ